MKLKTNTKSILSRFARESINRDSSLLSPPNDEANGNFCSGVMNTDVEIVPNTFDERIVPPKKRHCLGTSETDREGSAEPLLNLDACVVCDVEDKRVTRCFGVDCPLSFHGECLSTDLGGRSEDFAILYCPYCWLKVLTLKSKALKEKKVVVEKAKMKYLDKEMKSPDEDRTLSGGENENQDHSVDGTDIVSDQELQEEKDTCSSEGGYVNISRGENVQLIEATNQPEEDQGKLKVVTTDKVIDKVGASEGEEIVQKEKERRRRRWIELITIDSETSKGSSGKRNEEDVTEQVTSSAQVTSPSEKMKNQETTTRVAAMSKTVRDISFFKKDQRKRVLWTYKEEEMLKVGVEKFEAEAKRNMPWRKILEMGEKVFHETRTPADLKDKWRTMIGARLGPKTNRTATH